MGIIGREIYGGPPKYGGFTFYQNALRLEIVSKSNSTSVKGRANRRESMYADLRLPAGNLIKYKKKHTPKNNIL